MHAKRSTVLCILKCVPFNDIWVSNEHKRLSPQALFSRCFVHLRDDRVNQIYWYSQISIKYRERNIFHDFNSCPVWIGSPLFTIKCIKTYSPKPKYFSQNFGSTCDGCFESKGIKKHFFGTQIQANVPNFLFVFVLVWNN